MKEGDWKPESTKQEQPIGGVWGKARTFSLQNAQKLCRKPDIYVSPSSLQIQYIEVMAQVQPELFFDTLKPYWLFYSDEFTGYTFSYGLRFLSIGNQVLKLEQSNLEKAVFMNALLGTSLNDAGVACFYSKYHYNKEHPLTYIKRVIDPNWQTALVHPITKEKNLTPPYPSYPSGHATFFSSGAEALGQIFGYTYKMKDLSHIDKPEIQLDREFLSFYDMALEGSWSRVGTGTQLRMDLEEGIRFGSEIGRSVGKLPWQKK